MGWLPPMLKTRPLHASVTPARRKASAASSTKTKSLSWAPTTPLAAGLARTLDFYREHFEHYVPAASQVAAT